MMIENSTYANIRALVEEAYAQPELHLDFLSSRLFEWFKKKEGLKELQEKILVNPLIPSQSLKDAVLERNWVWERWMLADFQKSFPSSPSPFDGEPIESTVKIHLLAQKILNLLYRAERGISEALIVRNEESILANIGQSPEKLALKAVYYKEMARSYVQTQNLLATSWYLRDQKQKTMARIHSAECTTEKLTCESKKIQKEVSQARKEGVSTLASSQKDNLNRTSSLAMSIQETCDIQRKQTQEQEEKVRSLTERLARLGRL